MIQEGDTVIDVESEEKDELRVKSIRSDRAKEVFIRAIGKTVAEVNPEYPSDDKVAVCSYLIRHTEWNTGGVEHSYKVGEKRFSFPISRLEVTD